MGAGAASLDLRTSPLLRRAVVDPRLSVTEYLDDGPYSHASAEKDDVEDRVSRLLADLHHGAADRAMAVRYCWHMFPPDEITAARDQHRLGRLLAFAALQYQLDQALDDLDDRALNAPVPSDYVFAAHPQLFRELDPRDGLLRLTPCLIRDGRVGNEAIATFGADALF